MNWVDAVIVVVLLLSVLVSLHKSFTRELQQFITFLLSFILALRFYDLPAGFFEHTFGFAHSVATVVGFICVWVGVEILFVWLTSILLKSWTSWKKADQKLTSISFLPAFLRTLVFITLLLLIIATFPFQPTLKLSVQNSQIGSRLVSQTYQLESPLKQIFGGITNDSLAFLTVEPKTNETVALGFKLVNFKPRPDLETQMITLVNQERVKRGLNALSFNSDLQTIAREHSADMFERGYFSHYTPEGKDVADRAAAHHIDYQVIGENLAYAPTLILAHQGLMNSPGHRANILSEDYHHIGIGIMDGGAYGLMVTQVFTN